VRFLDFGLDLGVVKKKVVGPVQGFKGFVYDSRNCDRNEVGGGGEIFKCALGGDGEDRKRIIVSSWHFTNLHFGGFWGGVGCFLGFWQKNFKGGFKVWYDVLHTWVLKLFLGVEVGAWGLFDLGSLLRKTCPRTAGHPGRP